MKTLILGSHCILSTLVIQAQMDSISITSPLKDTLVSRFNRCDYNSFYEAGSANWKEKAAKVGINGWLQYINSLTGNVISCIAYKQTQGYTYYKWEGSKKTMCFTLKSTSLGIFDDFNFSFLNEPISSVESSMIPTDNPLKSSLDSAIHAITTSFMVYNKLVGISVGIIKKGKTYRYNYGTVDKRKQLLPTSDNIYELASIAKTFTGILLAQAILDKRIRPEDDIRKYLDGNYSNLEYHGIPLKIVHLANHTSGLLHELPDLSKYRSSFEVLKMYNNYTDNNFLEDLHHVTIDTLPGTRYQYSNVGVKLLGIILEHIYHMSFGDLLNKYITQPFDMKTTIPSFQISDTTCYMKGYDENGDIMPHNNFNMFGGSGAILSTVNDMILYMQQNISEKNSAVKLSHNLTSGTSKQGMGLCWEIKLDNKHGTEFWKDGGALGFRSYCIVIPQQQAGIIWLSNKSGLGEELGMMIEDLLDTITK